MAINETVLEMHYHKPLMQLFRDTYGIGNVGQLNFYKYSPQNEAFVGFDQAYAMSEQTDGEFLSELRDCAANNNYKLKKRFLAYFLQFKSVSEMQKFSKNKPPQIMSRPHYRASLDTTKNERTGFSQHELLYNLCRNSGALVYYACPMIFTKSELYEIDVDLDNLRLVDLTSCPSDFSDNSRHYIYFDQKDAEAIWCSDPVRGISISPTELTERAVSLLRQKSPKESAQEVSDLISSLKKLITSKDEVIEIGAAENDGLALFADSLTIISLEGPDEIA